MDHADLALRQTTYAMVVELGQVPSSARVAERLGVDREDVRAGWRRLHGEHALVLDRSGEIRMANPFSAVPTAYRVQAGGRWWFANCAWDAFGVCAALGADGRIATACADCREPIDVAVVERRPVPDDLVFHCLVPASQWWEDIGFT